MADMYKPELELEPELVKEALFNLYRYLRSNFAITGAVIAELVGNKLIDKDNNDQISKLIEDKKHLDAFQKWYDFAYNFYDANQLRKLCGCLREFTHKTSSSSMATLVRVADKIEEVMNKIGIPTRAREGKAKEKRRHEDIRADTLEKRFHTAGHDSSSDSDDVDSGPPDVVDDYEKVINLNNGGDLVQEDVWDDVRSAACGIMPPRNLFQKRPLNSEGKPCSRPLATAFVGLYKDECRLWTRRHCLYKDGDGKKATKERARNAEYWFLYRNDTKKEVVNGEKLILQDQDLLWDKKLDLLSLRVNKDELPEGVVPVTISEKLMEQSINWERYVVTIYGHPKGEPLTRSLGCVIRQKKNGVTFHECDTLKGSSGSMVVAVTGRNEVTVFAIHGKAGKENEKFNKASLLKPFLEEEF